VSTIVVEVMPKAELLDPQGKAVAGALARTGKGRFDVRVGKRFELTVDGPIDDDLRAAVREIAGDILSNSVIEDVVGIHYPSGETEEVRS
jgi:phosphoribosylformylglycinamidine synthase